MDYCGEVLSPSRTRRLEAVLILAAIGVLAFLLRTEEPEAGGDAPTSPIDGVFVCSNGYTGERLSFEGGRYRETYFGCVDRGVLSEGDFYLTQETVVLHDSQAGTRRSLAIIDGGLLEKNGPGHYSDFERTNSASGEEYVSASGRGGYIHIPQIEPNDPGKGREMFKQECSGCHGASGEGNSDIGDLREVHHPGSQTDLFTLNHIFRESLMCRSRHDPDFNLTDYWTVAFYIFNLRGREPVLP